MSDYNATYYEKLSNLQEKRRQNQSMQLALEREMFEIQSAPATRQNQAVYKAIRLQQYWRTITANARESELRNEALLRDVAKVQLNLNALEEKTNRLRELQRRYEQQVDQLYPGWREKAMQQQVQTQEQQQQQQQPQHHPLQSDTNIRNGPQFNAGYIALPDSHAGAYRLSHTMPASSTPHSVDDHVALTSGNRSQADHHSAMAQTQPNSIHSVQGSYREPVSSPVRPSRSGNRKSVVTRRRSEAKETSDRLESNPYTDKDRTDAEIASDFDDDSFSNAKDKSAGGYQKSRISSPQQRSGSDIARSPDHSHSESVPASDLTVEGLFHLLKELENTLKFTTDTQLIYRANIPPSAMRDEIIKCGNHGSTLSHLSSSTVSMVILDQLLLISLSLSDGCLLPDKLLQSVPLNITADILRERIHVTSQSLWDRLVSHFISLLTYRVMSVELIAETFSSLLVGKRSVLDEKAKQLLVALLSKIPIPSTGQSSVSASDVSSPKRPERRRSSTATNRNVNGGPVEGKKSVGSSGQRSPQKHSSLTFLASSMNDDSDADDDGGVGGSHPRGSNEFYPQQVPRANSTVPLTQTAAYRQLLNSTLSSSQHMYDESDDDEIEQQMALSSSRRGSRAAGASPRKSDSPQHSVKDSTGSNQTSPRHASMSDHEPKKSYSPSHAASVSSSVRTEKNIAFLHDYDAELEEDYQKIMLTDNKRKEIPDDDDFYK